MKDNTIILYNLGVLAVLLLLPILFACDRNVIDDTELIGVKPYDDGFEYKLPIRSAEAIADYAVLGDGVTRSAEDKNVSYILRNFKSRSNSNVCDTLAYVFQYGREGGFAIISYDKRISPLLAYSIEDSYSEENEIMKSVFADKLESYFDNVITCTTGDVVDTISMKKDRFLLNIQIPRITTTLDQWNPYNKYVDEKYPGFPTGCGATAIASAVLHLKDKLYYHGSAVCLESIRKAISGKECVDSSSHDYPVYTYSQGIDSVAWLMYNIAIDVNTEFIKTLGGEKVGSTKFMDMYSFFVRNKFGVSAYYSSYNIDNIEEIRKALWENRKMVFVWGLRNMSNGHFWLMDGCRFEQNELTEEVTGVMFHCDWGWGGLCNGYFKADVMAEQLPNYQALGYFLLDVEK